MPALLSRADLLRCLKSYGSENIESFAAVFGFERKELKLKEPQNDLDLDSGKDVNPSDHEPEILEGSYSPSARFLRVVAHRRFPEEGRNLYEPKWYKDAKPYDGSESTLKAKAGSSPPHQPLMPWRRLWPWLKLALGTNSPSHKINLPRVVDRLSRGEILRYLPVLKRKTWAANTHLLLDFDDSLLPFRTDFFALLTQLTRLRGQAGLEVFAFPDGDPTGRCLQRTAEGGFCELGYYPPPSSNISILVLSDLGCNNLNDNRHLCWRRFGHRLVHSGCRVMALMPCPPRKWDDELASLFILTYWDRAVQAPRVISRGNAHVPSSKQSERNLSDGERLLTLLATAVVIEPALLRAARYLFPAKEMDVGAEFVAWNHTAVKASPLGFYFTCENITKFRHALRDTDSITEEQKHKIAELMKLHHASLSPVISYEEQLIQAKLLGLPCSDEVEKFAARIAKTTGEAKGAIREPSRQWVGRLGARQHPSFWESDEQLAVAWIKAKDLNLANISNVPLPDGLSLGKFAWALSPHEIRCSQIYQQGETLRFSSSKNTYSYIAEVLHATEWIQLISRSVTSETKSSELCSMSQPIALNTDRSLILKTESEELHLDWLERPSWASTIGRDKFGLYAELEIKGVLQRFRWINPGTFMMGSPASEPERFYNETQHKVTLTKGYWLADTACTQELWQVVKGKNPSKFKDNANNPVESVSWKDTKRFIDKLNGMFSNLQARLPTDAEWEYACRAGTLTPFSFGENITPEQVNYNGNYPYAGGAKGTNRKKPVEVQSLPANPWGLYEMHGNVWEWCQDWYDGYTIEAVIDPAGPDSGSFRVLRGGSWIHDAGRVRAADRRRSGPACRHDYFGFRLALG